MIRRYYKLYGKNPSKNSLQKHLKRLRDRGLKPGWVSLGFSQAMQEVVERIYLAYDKFFKWAKTKKGPKCSPPKFRKFINYKSFTLKQCGWTLDEESNKIRLGNTWFKYNKDRNITGKIKTITVKRNSLGEWFIFISCDLSNFTQLRVEPMTGNIAGFDFGLKTFLVSSDNEHIESNEFLKNVLKELKTAQQELSRKKKGSKARKVSKIKVAKIYQKVTNKRNDFQFKLALDLVKRYDYLFFETLDLEEMKKRWGRKISDYSLYNFLKILEFKAREHLKVFFQVSKWFPSTKTCSCCGAVKEITLVERTYSCSHCLLEIDRDLNAALNIKKEGVSSLGLDRIMPSVSLVSIV